MPKEQWQSKALADIALAIKDGSHGTHKRIDIGVPFLSAKNISESAVLQMGESEEKISEQEYAAICAAFTPRENDLLLTIVGTLGRRALFDGSRVAFQRSVAFVRPDVRYVLPRFLLHVVGSHHYSRQLVRRSNATAQAGLYLGELAKTTIPVPPIPDQSRIAKVLDSSDEAIEKTKAVIAKLRKVRAGLLHDLLTRGLDQNGQLRDPVAHPEQFRESSLGCIPIDWKIESLETCCSHIVDCPHSTPNYLTDGVLVARTMQIRDGQYDEESSSRLTEDEYRERISRLKPEPGDVIFTREAPVAEAFVIPPGMRICLGQRVMLLRPNPERLTGGYLIAQIYSGAVRQRIEKLTGGTTNPHLNVDEVRAFALPRPDVDEQVRIAACLSELDELLRCEIANLKKLENVRSGLMADLLTGDIRVPDTLGATP